MTRIQAVRCHAISEDIGSVTLDELVLADPGHGEVLRRPRIAGLHGRTDEELDRFLTDLVANSVWREPVALETAPDSGDNQLWALLGTHSDACLVDRRSPVGFEPADPFPRDHAAPVCQGVLVPPIVIGIFMTCSRT